MRIVDRPIGEKSKSEIDRKLQGMGDYVKMSYLQRALHSGLDYETKKHVCLKLAEIYENRKMFMEAAKTLKSAAEINTTFKDKAADFMRTSELYVKGGDYIEADRIFSQAIALANNKEKSELKGQYKDFYIKQAREFLKSDKRNYARQVYEKALQLDLDIGERTQIHKELLELYNKLGLIREYYKLKDSM